MRDDDRQDTDKRSTTDSGNPSLEDIRLAHLNESQRISEAIRTGKIDHLRVSRSLIGQQLAQIPPEVRRLQLKRRADEAATIRTYSRITQAWRLNGDQTRSLLGNPDLDVWQAWQNGAGPSIPSETLERISYVFGIYKSLQILFQDKSQSHAWLHKPNRDFEGKTALEVMLAGRFREVRHYLDSFI